MERVVFEICSPTRCGYGLIKADMTLRDRRTTSPTHVLYTLDLALKQRMMLVYFSPSKESASKWGSNRCKVLERLLSTNR